MLLVHNSVYFFYLYIKERSADILALFKIFKGSDSNKLTKPGTTGYLTPTDGYAYYDTTTKLLTVTFSKSCPYLYISIDESTKPIRVGYKDDNGNDFIICTSDDLKNAEKIYNSRKQEIPLSCCR